MPEDLPTPEKSIQQIEKEQMARPRNQRWHHCTCFRSKYCVRVGNLVRVLL